MFLLVKSYLTTFWRFYVLILTPFILIPIVLSGIPSQTDSFSDADIIHPKTTLLQSNISTTATTSTTTTTTITPENSIKNNYEPMVCAYVLALMSIYWMTEVLPPPVTSLVPLVAFPLFGVLSTNEVAVNYMRATNFMMLGGLMLAVCVEYSGLHRRIALRIVLLMGTSPKTAMFGFMLTTAIVSMFISNAASTAMMVPIVEAFAEVAHRNSERALEEVESGKSSSLAFEKQRNLLLLSVAYAASIGGTGVITGNPSNLVVLEVLPPEAGVSFATWMAFSMPLMLVNLICAWLWLLQMSRWMGTKKSEKLAAEKEFTNCELDTIVEIQRKEENNANAHKDLNMNEVKSVLRRQYEALGPTTIHEWSILISFSILILLWFFRQPMFVTGWGDYLARMTSRGSKSSVADATPAMFMIFVIFALPTQYRFWPFRTGSEKPESSPSLITWDIIERRLPWGVLLFVGGGFALSDACTKTGFSAWLVQYLVYLKGLPIWIINLIVSTLTATMTEVVSNTATANILLPILKEMSLTLCYNPVYMVMCSVVTCCYAFMLPVATAPNAIVFQASSMKTSDMMKAGLPLNIICVLTTNIAINTYGSLLFGLNAFPEWAIDAAEKIDITGCTNSSSIL